MAFNLTLRKSFLYIFATLGLVLIVIGAVMLINLGLKTYVFTKADNYCFTQTAPMSLDKNGVAVEPTPAQQEAQLKQCEDQQTASKQGQASNAIALLIVGAPLYLFHWIRIKKENQV